MERTKTDITVKVRDLSDIKEDATAAYNNSIDDEKKPADTVGLDGPWGTIEVDDDVFAVCEEGVGNKFAVTNKTPLLVPVRPEWIQDDGKRSMSAIPTGQFSITRTMLERQPVQDTTLLHKFIRSVANPNPGHRLEKNYDRFRRLIEFKQSDETGYEIIRKGNDEQVRGDFMRESFAEDFLELAINEERIEPLDRDAYIICEE